MLVFLSIETYRIPSVFITSLFFIVIVWFIITDEFKAFVLYENKLHIQNSVRPFSMPSEFLLSEIKTLEINIHVWHSPSTLLIHLKNGKTKIFSFSFVNDEFQNFIDAVRNLGIPVVIMRSHGELK